MQIADFGEFVLIDRLKKLLDGNREDVVVGIGDDVAVLAESGQTLLLATIDSQVEGVHFLRDRITPRQLGRRALAINLSDIAAMGGQAQFALVSLVLPRETEISWVEELYLGLREEAERFGVAIVGGNMARSPGKTMIDICVLGRVTRERLLLRSRASAGDLVLVTGQLGDSAAGLELLSREYAHEPPVTGLTESERAQLLQRHFTPTPRLAEAECVARTGQASAMLDLSDGLSSDIIHICENSNVGVRIVAEHLPISVAARKVASLVDRPASQLALEGGEDYELCFTAPAEIAESLATQVRHETGTIVTVIGEILPADQGRTLVMETGEVVPLEAKGWSHF